MAHVQQQVLEAVQAVLIAAATDAGSNVFLDRVDPVPAKSLPAILVYESDQGETAQPYTVHGLEQRTLSVVTAGVVKHCADAPKNARAFGLAVEVALNEDEGDTLAALCKLGWRMVTSRQINSGEGENLVAAREQVWQFTYLVNPAAPDVVA